MQLRPYQIEAVESVYDYFSCNTGNPLVACPTGTGKALIIAAFIKRTFFEFPNQRVLVLSHVREILTQDLKALTSFWPTAPAGVYSAGLGRRDINLPIIFAGIQSVYQKAPHFGRVDLVLVDECHLVSQSGNTMYRSFLNDLKNTNPALKVIGLTATPFRLGLGYLTDGDLFDHICFDITSKDQFNDLVKQGYLCRLVAKKTKTELDVSNVKIQAGEFVQRDLEKAVDKEAITTAGVEEMTRLGYNRKKWLIFASGIDHAEHIAFELRRCGIATGIVHSKMKGNRDDVLAKFRAGELKAIVNQNILTTGFDLPEIDLIGMFRPTNSPVLHVQSLGRGTRPASGKSDCLVLDFAGNMARLGPINDVMIPRPKGQGRGQAPTKVCGECSTYNHISARVCEECSAEFKFAVKITPNASTINPISDGLPQVETFKVTKVQYSKHEKRGSPPSLKVTYLCGLRMFHEWICLEHEGYAKRKARSWWVERGFDDIPKTVDDALGRTEELIWPETIRVRVDTKYPEILNYDYVRGEAAPA